MSRSNSLAVFSAPVLQSSTLRVFPVAESNGAQGEHAPARAQNGYLRGVVCTVIQRSSVNSAIAALPPKRP